MADNKLNALAFGYAGATVSAACMLLLGILAPLGLYKGAAERMMDWHLFFSLTPLGVVAGMIEAAVIGFVFAWAFGWLYNKFA